MGVKCEPFHYCERQARQLGACVAGKCNPPAQVPRSCGNCADGVPGGPDNCSKCGREQQYSHWTLRTDGVTAAPAPEVTDAMVDAYLQANDAYWKRTDELPTPPDKWRTGTPREATRESLRAALGVPVVHGQTFPPSGADGGS